MQRARLHSLKQRHAQLEARLHLENTRPCPSPLVIQKLKKEKLHVRDQITALMIMPIAA